VRRLRRLHASRPLSGRELHDGTYSVAFTSGADVRRVAAVRRHGRFVTAHGRIDIVSSCGRADVAAPLFGPPGLVVHATGPAPGDHIALSARRVSGGPRRTLAAGGQTPLTATLGLGHGTWHVSVRVRGRRIGTLVARRPR
jgi:hypothetical protein